MSLFSTALLRAGTVLLISTCLVRGVEPIPTITPIPTLTPKFVERPAGTTTTQTTLATQGVTKPQRDDIEAIISALKSGIPLTSAQQQFLTTLSQAAMQDINARLFRMRAGVTLRDDSGTGAGGPTGPGRDGKEAKTVQEPELLRWELFASGNYGSFDLNDQGRRAGFEADTWVGTIGAEYRLTRNVSFGLAAAWIDGRADLSRKLGGIDSQGLALSAYGSAVWDNFYADLLYSFGRLDQDVRRNTFTGRTARGDTEATTNAIQFNTGYIFKLGQLHTGPIASLNWIHGDIDGYRETGGGSSNLVIPEQDVDSLISQLGWSTSYVITTSFGTIVPQIRASWDHEYLNSADSVSATLRQSPFANGGRYTASGQGAEAGRDYLNLGAGIESKLGDRVSLTLDYQTHLFQQRTTAHFGSVKIGIAF